MDIQTGVLLASGWQPFCFLEEGRTSKKGQTEEQNHTQVETNQKNDTEPFDYGHFRDKLRRSWGLDQASSEMNKELSQEESEQVVPKKQMQFRETVLFPDFREKSEKAENRSMRKTGSNG